MTLERPMFPPVDQARRHLLTVAAGGTVAAVVGIPTSTSAEGINPSANKTNVLAIRTPSEEITPSQGIDGDPLIAPHPDAKLLELGSEYERLWAIEEPLGEESFRLWNAADRLRYEKLGVDPDDKEACRAALDNRHSEWNAVREIADEEVGYNKAWRKMNRASLKTERIGKKILKIAPNTMAGLLVRIRVIETHEGELLAVEPAEQLLADIRDFAKRVAALANAVRFLLASQVERTPDALRTHCHAKWSGPEHLRLTPEHRRYRCGLINRIFHGLYLSKLEDKRPQLGGN